MATTIRHIESDPVSYLSEYFGETFRHIETRTSDDGVYILIYFAFVRTGVLCKDASFFILTEDGWVLQTLHVRPHLTDYDCLLLVKNYYSWKYFSKDRDNNYNYVVRTLGDLGDVYKLHTVNREVVDEIKKYYELKENSIIFELAKLVKGAEKHYKQRDFLLEQLEYLISEN